jgi:molybdate transport system regulatory protein
MPNPVLPPPAAPSVSPEVGVRPRIRVLRGRDIALGPGKVALLEAIESHQCLADAARALGMSYMRAWKLLQTMNVSFREPLVVTHRGGKLHGSAALTPAGARALELYRRMERDSLDAIAGSWDELRGMLA